MKLIGSKFVFAALIAPALTLCAVEVTNIHDKDVLRYPVIVVEGSYAGDLVVTAQESAGRMPSATSIDKLEGKFRGIVELKVGENRVTFKDSKGAKTFLLTYKPPTTTDYMTKFWYVIPKGETPEPNTPGKVDSLYRIKLENFAKLMQTWCAEDMKRYGYGPKTFFHPLDKNDLNKFDIGLIEVPYTREEWLKNQSSFGLFGKHLPKEYKTGKWKNVGFVACKDAALSSGDACIVGYNTLITRGSTNLAETIQYLHMTGKGLTYSTYMGVTLHEFGHTIHWAWHPGGKSNVIQTAYDISRSFTVANKDGKLHLDQNRSTWGVHRELFNNSRFIWASGDPVQYANGKIAFDLSGGNMTVKSDYPLGAVYTYKPNGNATVFHVPEKNARTWSRPISEILTDVKSDKFHYMVVDKEGNEAHSVYKGDAK